jgi:hypothetical protein
MDVEVKVSFRKAEPSENDAMTHLESPNFAEVAKSETRFDSVH